MYMSLFRHNKYVCTRELPHGFVSLLRDTFLHPEVHRGNFSSEFNQEHKRALRFNDTLTKFLIDWEITRKEANELKVFFAKNRDRFVRSHPEYATTYDDMCDMLYLLIRHMYEYARFHNS